MKVFISWSGERSKQMAKALDDWLPKVLQQVDPWMSESDISAGERWSVELSKQLEASEFGIICLTPDNVSAPWLLFEAGAISRSLSSGAVCPYLLDLDVRDISGPLGQFQAKKADKRSTLDLLNAINQRTQKPVPGLEDLFEAMWPRFEAELQAILPSKESQTVATRSEAEILEELVSTVRRFDQSLSDYGQLLMRMAEELQKVLGSEILLEGQPGGSVGPWDLWGLINAFEKRIRQSRQPVSGEEELPHLPDGTGQTATPSEEG
jgi:hypothetical protein